MTDTTELELLGLLQEESAEIIQIISKVRRFGFDSYNPYDPSGKNNKTLTTDEIGDFYAIMALLYDRGTFDPEAVQARVKWKLEKLEKHWGYKLEQPLPDNQSLIDDLTTTLSFLQRLTKQGEDSIWRPATAAIPNVERAIAALSK